MKRIWKTALFLLVLSAMLAIPAFAASGVTEDGTDWNWTYTATYEGTIKVNEMYLIFAIKTSALNAGGLPSMITADSILYIGQKAVAAEDVAAGKLTFTGFIPMNYSGGKVFLSGGKLGAPIELGVLESHGFLGDVNDDTNVNALDAQLILQNAVGKIGFTPQQLYLGNVNGDSKVNALDAQLVLQYAVGKLDANFKPR